VAEITEQKFQQLSGTQLKLEPGCDSCRRSTGHHESDASKTARFRIETSEKRPLKCCNAAPVLN